MPNPESTYDSLFILKRLEDPLRGVTEGEVHLFAYLSSLLGLFRGRPATDWGYTFARTRWGSPFSPAVGEALKELQLGGHIEKHLNDAIATLICTNEGSALLDSLDEFELSRDRLEFLNAACSSAFTLPVSAIRQAIRMEPTFKSAAGHLGPQELLTGPSLELLYEQFGAIREVLGLNTSDLLVPSSVWLSYLMEKGAEPST
jgi:hypothetical protein